MVRESKPVFWGEARISARPDRPWSTPSPLYNGHAVSFPGEKRPGRGERMRVYQCVSAVGATGVPVLVCLCRIYNHVTYRMAVGYVRPALLVVRRNDGDFVDMMLL